MNRGRWWALVGLALLALAPPMQGQQACEHVAFIRTGGERYLVFAGDSQVSARGDRDKALEDIQAWKRARPHLKVFAIPAFEIRGECQPSPVPDVTDPPPDSLPADSGAVPPPPPPVDTMPPLDTTVTPPPPPPVDTVVVPPPDTVPAGGFRFVSAQQLADWQALKASNDPLYQLAATNCGRTATGNERYADTGLWCSWIAVVDGDTTAARKAVSKLRSISAGFNTNAVREAFIERVLQRDLLGAWLTAADRAVIDPVLDQWAGRTILASDSDQMTGAGCGTILWDLAQGGTRNVAGYRNAIAGYVQRADGGVWIESGKYNLGTALLFTSCARAYRTATGQELVPGAEQLVRDLGRVTAWEITPDTASAFQWGDEEDPGDLHLDRRTTLLANMDHPEAVDGLNRLYARFGRFGYGSAEPFARALLWAAPGRAAAPPGDTSLVAPGMGAVFLRSGSVAAMAMAIPNTGVHHTDLTAPFQMQVYDRGCLLCFPQGYGHGVHEYAFNGPTYAGMPMFTSRRVAWTQQGDGWVAVAGVSSGIQVGAVYPAPPTWLRHGGRVAVLLDNGAAIVRDSVDMTDPRTLPGFPTGFREKGLYLHQSRIREFDGAPWALWHMPVQPTVGATDISWTASNGVPVRVVLCTPAQVAVVDENTIWTGIAPVPSQRRWQARVRLGTVTLQVFAPAAVPVSCTANGATVADRTFTLTATGVVES